MLNKYEELLFKKYVKTAYNFTVFEERFLHSLSVAKKAEEIVLRFNLDVDLEKTLIAATLHDYAKFETIDRFKEIVQEYSLNEAILDNNFKILHALLGPYFLMKELDIKDHEILDAVRYHATGALEMSQMAEVIFLADYVEDLREEEYFKEARRLANIDFQKAILEKVKGALSRNLNSDLYQELYKKYQEN